MKFPFSGYQCLTDEYSYIKALISKKMHKESSTIPPDPHACTYRLFSRIYS